MFHLSTEMQIQLSCFAALVIVCIAGTRLIYHDGIVGDNRRLKWHCQMQAALILILCGWAGSIVFRINESCIAIIEQQSETINNLQATRGSSVDNHITSNAPAKGIINAHQTEIDQTQATTAVTRTLVTASGTVIRFGTDAESNSACTDRPMPRTSNGLGWNYSDDRHVDGTDRRTDDTVGRSDRYGGRTIGRIRSLPLATPSLSDLR